MGSELLLPELPPIRTSGVEDVDRQPPKPANSIKEEHSEVAPASEECVTTPRSEDHVLKPALLVCPPPPRKPRPARRKFTAPAPARGFHPVPDDLASVFVPLPCPACKKIRVR